MKSRLSYFLISGIIILSIFIGTFIWRNKYIKETPKLNQKSFTAPISSKYIPTNADLILHWKINPTMLPNYLENLQDKKNKIDNNEKIKLIRDSAFALMSLDFKKDISNLFGEYGSLAIFDTNQQLINDWLMVIETNKDINIDDELELISSLNIIDEDIDNSSKENISKFKIISKKLNSNESIYFSKSQEHILISSNPEKINSSINQFEDNKLSMKKKYKSIQLKNNLNDGFLLLELSPKKFLNFLDYKKDLFELDHTEKLFLSMNIDKRNLILEGVLSYDNKISRPINDLSNDLIDLEEEFNTVENLILIDNPKQYFGEKFNYPYKKLIASIIKESTTSDYSNLFKIILENTKGSLIWIKDKDKEWLSLSNKADTNKQKINDGLKKENFSNSKLGFKDKTLEVWSKITTNNNEKYEISENIEAIIEENKDVYIWSQDLASIANFDNKQFVSNHIDIESKDSDNNDFDNAIKISLGSKKTEVLLNSFYPYILIRAMLGGKLNPPQNIDISLAIPAINYPDFVKFRINLKTS